jgi:hypothetical protein
MRPAVAAPAAAFAGARVVAQQVARNPARG